MEILKFLYEVNTVNAYRVGWSRKSVAGCLIHRRYLGYGDSITITQETTIYRGESQNLVARCARTSSKKSNTTKYLCPVNAVE